MTAAVDEVAVAVQDTSGGGGELVGPDAIEVLRVVLAQVSRLTVAAVRLSTGVDDDGLWAIEGARSFARWVASVTGMSYVSARELAATGRKLRDHLPATAAAGLSSEIGAEQVAVLAKLAPTSAARCAALAAPAEACGEGFLVAQAKLDGVDGFRRLVRRWAAAADPEADEHGYREACEREFVALSPTLGGFHLSGFLTTEHGAAVNAALDAVMTPPAADDGRTAQQRRAQELADVARLVLDRGLVGTGAAVRPHLSVVVDFDTLRRAVEGRGAASESGGVAGAGASGGDAGGHGAIDVDVDVGGGVRLGEGPDGLRDASSAGFRRPAAAAPVAGDCLFRLAPVADVERFAVAEVLGAGPIPPSLLARLACDGEVSRVVFGPDSQVINVGRAERTYSGPRRKAVIARDGHCRYPGCTAPPALREIHHVEQWARDHGDTDANTGILPCWHHHDLVHRLRIDIHRTPTGGWTFTRHDTPITAAG